jgi:hypothetical protein
MKFDDGIMLHIYLLLSTMCREMNRALINALANVVGENNNVIYEVEK